MTLIENEPSWPTRGTPTLRAAGTADVAAARRDPTIPLGDGICLFLAGLEDTTDPVSARAALIQRLSKPPETPEGLQLALLSAMREIEPAPYCFAAVVFSGSFTLVATALGATVTLVRKGVLCDRVTDVGVLDVRENDRLALLCARLSPLLPDDKELVRIVTSDEPAACAMTLVEVGHFRGGLDLMAVVAQIGPPVARPEEAPMADLGLGDLVASLAPAVDRVRKRKTRLRPRRSLLRMPPPRSDEPATAPIMPERDTYPPEAGIVLEPPAPDVPATVAEVIFFEPPPITATPAPPRSRSSRPGLGGVLAFMVALVALLTLGATLIGLWTWLS